MKKTVLILALSITLLAARADAQIYAFHSDIQGIYWNPELAGWGFAFDVQKGILFGAVYGYDNQGEPVFYTLISEKANGNAGLTFNGNAFLTRGNGTSTEPVGSFDLQFGRGEGQPAISIDMTTPSLNLSGFRLIRFSYSETGELGLLSGTQVRTWFGQGADAQNQNGISWSFGNTRTPVDGRDTIDVLDSQGRSGFAALTETDTITTYVVFFPVENNQTLTYDYDVLNGRGGQGVRVTIDSQGTPVGNLDTFASAVVAVDEASNKAGLEPISVTQRTTILAAFRQYLEVTGR